MKRIKCPICGKELIQINIITEDNSYKYYYNFWCDDCNIDIQIRADKEI